MPSALAISGAANASATIAAMATSATMAILLRSIRRSEARQKPSERACRAVVPSAGVSRGDGAAAPAAAS